MSKMKLIEAVMPVSVINSESERERGSRGGLPRNVHLWWSRRPMAAARSTIFASCVDDPSEHPELFPTVEEQAQERQRLLAITEALAQVENGTNEELLSTARCEIERYTDESLPVVFDPFVGGGAIPVEAQRLGLSSVSSDLNPVAVMITKLVADIPARFVDIDQVYLDEDVKNYGQWMLSEAEKRIGQLYPKITSPETGEELDVSAWIWARTVKCPNPSCGCEIPLSSSYNLARKKGSEAWVEPCVEDGTVRFRIHHEGGASGTGKPKVAQKAVFKCPCCGEITTDTYVKECGLDHRINSQLIAIVAEDSKRRKYFPANREHEAIANAPMPEDVPHGALPDFPRRFSPPTFGLTDYADLFTTRQLIFLTTMMRMAREVQDTLEKEAVKRGLPDDGISFEAGGCGALAYAQAVRIALVLTVSKLLDRCSNICSWDSSGGGALRSVFSRAAMPMIWDYAESNPFGSSGGSFANALSRTCDAIAALPEGVSSDTIMHDASMPNQVRGAMLHTDLPYYDKASYGDLSDFFYVWLRYGMGDLFPDCFRSEVTPKKGELTAFPYRWKGDRQQANVFYAEGLTLAMKNLYESVTEDYPSTIAFQYKGNDAKPDGTLSEWETFVTAVSEAGFMITASWPLGRKYGSSIEQDETRGIPITVVVKKKREHAPDTTRRSFVAAVKREVPVIVRTLESDVELEDLRASVIGQALSTFTRYGKVLDADGAAMKPYIASRIIEQELDMILTTIYESAGTMGDDKEEKIDD